MRRYLHFITKPYSVSIIEPLFHEIENEKRGESLIFISEKIKPFINPELPITASISEAINFKPDVVFIPGNIVHDKIPGLKVQIFHGLCEEKGGHYKITGFFDLYCTSGPLVTRKFKTLSEKYKHFLVVETGWSKVDEILKPFNKKEICERLGVDPSKKIILYAPTFSPRFKSSSKILPFIENMPGNDEKWIIKFHDLVNPKDVVKFSHLQQKSFLLYTSPDITPLLQISDVLISDASSVVYEFILLDKPVITIDSKVRLGKGINITDISQLRSAIDHSIADPEDFSIGRKKTIDQIHPYRDTRNSERVLNAVESVLKSELVKVLRKKPLNLYRKIQVCRKFGYW